MLFRRSKYMDVFLCALFIVLLVYAFFSRRVLLDKLRREEEERLKLEHSANSLKEELKIVYYHTSKLEEALKAEQDRHKSTTSQLSSQSQDFRVNVTMLQKQYTLKLKEKTDSIKAYIKENAELKEKHRLVEKHFSELSEEHKTVAARVKREYDLLKAKKEQESLQLQDQIQDTYNQKVYFQKKSLQNEEDYKKTLKKLVRCKAIVSRRNVTSARKGAAGAVGGGRSKTVVVQGKGDVVVDNGAKVLPKLNDNPGAVVGDETTIVATSQQQTATRNNKTEINKVDSPPNRYNLNLEDSSNEAAVINRNESIVLNPRSSSNSDSTLTKVVSSDASLDATSFEQKVLDGKETPGNSRVDKVTVTVNNSSVVSPLSDENPAIPPVDT